MGEKYNLWVRKDYDGKKTLKKVSMTVFAEIWILFITYNYAGS